MKFARVFTSLTGILTVGVLTTGLIAGVSLVRQNQNIQNKADELKQHKVTLCHKTGSESNPWVQIEVSDNAKDAHLSQGDIEGNCPESDKDKEKDKDKGNKGGNGDHGNGNSRGTGGVSLANNVTVNNQTVAADQVEVQTKYVFVTTQFDFKVKFQGN